MTPEQRDASRYQTLKELLAKEIEQTRTRPNDLYWAGRRDALNGVQAYITGIERA